MEKDPRFPEFSPDIQVDGDYASEFQSTVVHPAINHLWGDDFIQKVRRGYDLTKSVPLETELEEECYVTIELYLELVDDGEDEFDAVIMALRIARKDDTILPDILRAYYMERLQAMKKTGEKVNRKKRRKLMRSIENEDLTCWQSAAYSFNTMAAAGFGVSRAYELYEDGLKGTQRWTTNSFIWEDEVEDNRGEEGDEDNGQDMDKTLAKLDNGFETSITPDDYFAIMDAFEALGVPKSVYEE